MITRIVKMTFKPEQVTLFLGFFEENKTKIRAFKGCKKLVLLQDVTNPCTIFTYSWWHNEECLNQYRHSQLFKKVWAQTKVLFSHKPQAWSVTEKANL
jgi:quinol monooxygenase YgiN